ncbi:DUF5677 domain-containing protein [Peptostreptococcus porci]|uniref:DUF5677 domain-containing protein n=1 Tax=Peptostreptococcus porci TaxID=2652282 RepID=UPI002A809339|nr:DUF5677 domain-containing protein [Peptostreptococcus porci]MDY4128275.1 DUF5677 domain-containing protein [Peptostreptococcus porci]
MKDSYLKEFNYLFFDIEEYKGVKDIIEEASFVFELIIAKFGEFEKKMIEKSFSSDNFADAVIISFIRKIMEQLDSINVLFSVGHTVPAQILLRALIENIVELQFILKENTEKRAAAYYLEYHYQDIDKGESYFNHKNEHIKTILNIKEKDRFDKEYKNLEKKKQVLKKVIDSKKILKEMSEARERKLNSKRGSRKNKKVYIKWYELCGKKNFKDLMQEAGYEEFYYSIYGGLSFELHGFNAIMGIDINENIFLLKPIRNLEGKSVTFELTYIFSIMLLQKICEYLGNGECEIAKFKKFYDMIEEKHKESISNLVRIK